MSNWEEELLWERMGVFKTAIRDARTGSSFLGCGGFGSNLGYMTRIMMLGSRLGGLLMNAGGWGVVGGGEERRPG